MNYTFREEDEIEIYPNESGGITIRQRNFQQDDGWEYITIYSKQRSYAISKAIRDLAKSLEFTQNESTE